MKFKKISLNVAFVDYNYDTVVSFKLLYIKTTINTIKIITFNIINIHGAIVSIVLAGLLILFSSISFIKLAHVAIHTLTISIKKQIKTLKSNR